MGSCCGQRNSNGVRSQQVEKCAGCGLPLRGVHTFDKDSKKLVKTTACLNRKCASNKWKPRSQ